MSKRHHSSQKALLRSIKIDPLTNEIERVVHVSFKHSSIIISIPFKEFISSKLSLKETISSLLIEDVGEWHHNIAPTRVTKILEKRSQKVPLSILLNKVCSYSLPPTQPIIKYNQTLDDVYYKIRLGAQVLWVTRKTYETFFRSSPPPERNSIPPVC
jgi:hypothetical protein